MKEISIKLLNTQNIPEILILTKQSNKNIPISELENMQTQMFEFENYKCFGLFENDLLIGVSSGWITIKLYSGKQLELDNVVVDASFHSKGYGKKFMAKIEAWAKTNHFKTLELNTYVFNDRSHKFYFNQGYKIIGYHFQKDIAK